MNEEITKMSLLITHLDVSTETKEKLYTQNYKIATEIERLNNKIKEQSLLLIEFQDMEQRLKEKDDIIDKLENWLNIEIDRIEKMINPKAGIKPYGEELTYLRTIKNSYIYAKNKLKELKESGE